MSVNSIGTSTLGIPFNRNPANIIVIRYKLVFTFLLNNLMSVNNRIKQNTKFITQKIIIGTGDSLGRVSNCINIEDFSLIVFWVRDFSCVVMLIIINFNFPSNWILV